MNKAEKLKDESAKKLAEEMTQIEAKLWSLVDPRADRIAFGDMIFTVGLIVKKNLPGADLDFQGRVSTRLGHTYDVAKPPPSSKHSLSPNS